MLEPGLPVLTAESFPIAAAGTSPAGTQMGDASTAGTQMGDASPAETQMVHPGAAGTAVQSAAKIEGPRLILLYIRESGDRARDTRRLRILYGLLCSYPGRDHFAFQVSEDHRTYRLEFPTNTTSWTPELERKVLHLVGAGCVEIQPFCVQ